MVDGLPTVVVLSPVHASLLDWLSARAVVHHVPDAADVDPDDPVHARAHVLVVRSNVRMAAADVPRLPRLRLVLRAGSGTDNLPLDDLRSRGVTVAVLGGGPAAPAVAELAVQSAVALLRRVPVATAELTAGRWAKDRCLGEEMAGAVVAVWGAGPLGLAIERLFTVTGAQAYVVTTRAMPPGVRTMAADRSMDTARVHVFALPLRPDTRRMVDRAMLDRLGATRPHLVNVARWDLFDMPAVVRALSRGELSGVAVDPVDRGHVAPAADLVARFTAPGRPLNLQLLPHLGATTAETQRRVASAAVEALTAHWHLLGPDLAHHVQPQEAP